jgi:hypothetical protein
VPTAAPASTSELQCTPTCTRDQATAAASGATASPARGLSMATAVVNAAAEAACPEGNELEVGRRRSRRSGGISASGGRRRGSSGLSTALAVVLAPRMATRPRRAARRVVPARPASTAATVNQSRLWFADLLRRLNARSAGPTGSSATLCCTARSDRSANSTTRRNHSLTGSTLRAAQRLG